MNIRSTHDSLLMFRAETILPGFGTGSKTSFPVGLWNAFWKSDNQTLGCRPNFTEGKRPEFRQKRTVRTGTPAMRATCSSLSKQSPRYLLRSIFLLSDISPSSQNPLNLILYFRGFVFLHLLLVFGNGDFFNLFPGIGVHITNIVIFPFLSSRS
jgi:hypothetical protein